MDISQAMVERIGFNEVRICAPPWLLLARVAIVDGRPRLVDLAITNTDGITGAALAEIPIRSITNIAAGAIYGGEESLYRRLATSLEDSQHRRPSAGRSWGPDHYQRVAEVAAWATRSRRPGRPAEAIADFWGVSVRTARRWLAAASRREARDEAAQPESSPDPKRG